MVTSLPLLRTAHVGTTVTLLSSGSLVVRGETHADAACRNVMRVAPCAEISMVPLDSVDRKGSPTP
jgi:hypothetical protein